MAIFKLWFTWYSVFIFCTTFSSCSKGDYQMADAETEIFSNDADCVGEVGETVKDIGKRAINNAAKGLAALGKLLRGAKEARTMSVKYVLYEKDGNLETALKDFDSVQPTLTSIKKNRPTFSNRSGRLGNAFLGTVGDRRLILMPTGDRNSRYAPVLEIRSPTDAVFVRIVYKVTKN